MSKGRVWNKGKRNGGGGPPKSAIPSVPRVVGGTGSIKPEVREGTEESFDKTDLTADKTNVTASVERIEQVKRANRSNWVTRPTRVKREKHD